VNAQAQTRSRPSTTIRQSTTEASRAAQAAPEHDEPLKHRPSTRSRKRGPEHDEPLMHQPTTDSRRSINRAHKVAEASIEHREPQAPLQHSKTQAPPEHGKAISTLAKTRPTRWHPRPQDQPNSPNCTPGPIGTTGTGEELTATTSTTGVVSATDTARTTSTPTANTTSITDTAAVIRTMTGHPHEARRTRTTSACRSTRAYQSLRFRSRSTQTNCPEKG
jgi:hypothetical protein